MCLSKKLCTYVNMARVSCHIPWHPVKNTYSLCVPRHSKWAVEGRCALRAKQALYLGSVFKAAVKSCRCHPGPRTPTRATVAPALLHSGAMSRCRWPSTAGKQAASLKYLLWASPGDTSLGSIPWATQVFVPSKQIWDACKRANLGWKMPGLWWQYQFKCISKYCLILIPLLALLFIPLLPALEDVWNTLTMCMLSLHRQNSRLCIYLVCTPGLTQVPPVKLTPSKMFAPSVVPTPSFCV